MFEELFKCLLGCMFKCKTHCKCSACCESDCMMEEGDQLKRANSRTSLKVNSTEKKSI